MKKKWTSIKPNKSGIYAIYIPESDFYDPPRIVGVDFTPFSKGKVMDCFGLWLDNVDELDAKGALWLEIVIEKPILEV